MESSSPTNFASSFASAIREGAMKRFFLRVGLTTSASDRGFSDRVVDAALDRHRRCPEGHRAVGLRIEIDEESRLSAEGESRR